MSRGQAAGGFSSDELYFTGFDMGRDGRGAGNGYLDDGSYSDAYGPYDEEARYEYEQQMLAYQAAERDREEALVHSYLEKIRKARSQGKSSANLKQDEVDAYERWREQQQPRETSVSPAPQTPSKKKKGSRSSSLISLSDSKSRKKSSAPSPAARSRKTPKPSRKSSSGNQSDSAAAYASGSTAPGGFMVPGPNGQPVYAPFGYYSPPPDPRGSPYASRPGPRSASANSKRQPTPPFDPQPPFPYAAYPPRYYGPPPPDLRPPSNSSDRSLDDRRGPASRTRSASSAQYMSDAGGYGSPPLPAAHARRNFSGPPDVSYAGLRRVPPSSPLAAGVASSSDPSLPRRRSGVDEETEGESSSEESAEDDDEGVQVEVRVDGEREDGYRVKRVPVGGGKGKRKGKR